MVSKGRRLDGRIVALVGFLLSRFSVLVLWLPPRSGRCDQLSAEMKREERSIAVLCYALCRVCFSFLWACGAKVLFCAIVGCECSSR